MRVGAGPVVLITGAAGGIGRALAHRYARDGARLVLVDRDAHGLSELTGALPAELETLPRVCDITDRAACAACVDEVVATLGPVDVLVNNAGITHLGTLAETDAEVIQHVMAVNFFGALYMAKAVLPGMVQAGGGRIAVLSSVAGFAPLSGRSGYAASKHALHGLFDSLRGELAGSGISVTLVCPTFTRTGIGAGALGVHGGPASVERTETGEILEPEAVAEAVHAGVARGRRLVLVGRTARLARLVSRFAPGFYERLMVRRLEG
jgi:short-subunit dehydrogenase